MNPSSDHFHTDAVLPSSDHCRTETVLPPRDHYCLETVAPRLSPLCDGGEVFGGGGGGAGLFKFKLPAAEEVGLCLRFTTVRVD